MFPIADILVALLVLFGGVFGQNFSEVTSTVTPEGRNISTDTYTASSAEQTTVSTEQTTVYFVSSTAPSSNYLNSSGTDKSNSSDKQKLPLHWDQFCSLQSDRDDNLFYQCKIGRKDSGKWRLNILRNWISNMNATYSFEIICSENANISIQWPIKILRMVQLTVNDCLIVDFFDDYNNMDNISKIPDQLEILSFTSVRIFVKLFDLLPIFMNIENIPKDFDCGHEETLRVYVYKNISYAFTQEEIDLFKGGNNKGGDKQPDVLDVGKGLVDGSRHIEHKCNFIKLEHVDQSISNSKSKFHMTLLTANSFFPKVKTYNLSKTGMMEITQQMKRWWLYFPNLEYLDLSNNHIKTIGIDPASHAWKADTKNLTINLQNNNISSLTADDTEMLALQTNMFVKLEGNPFHCECSPKELAFLKMVQTDTIWMEEKYKRYNYLRHLKCKSPAIASGKEFIKLTNNSLPCPVKLKKVVELDEGYLPLPLLVLLIVTVIVLIIVIIILARFRLEIRILTYTRFNIILPCQPVEKYETKIFDAFVSYNNADEEWVSETFENLEKMKSGNSPSFRFCLHQRDFIPGKTIFDNVIDSVEASRHTVIILSKYFLQSNFCMYEFHEAFQQSIIERKRHLIVVLMEDIPEKELPNDLKRCLKTFTYIKKDDMIFTDRLVYALSCKNKRRSKLDSIRGIDSNENLTSVSTCESTFTESTDQSPSVVSVSSLPPVFPLNFNPEKQQKNEMYLNSEKQQKEEIYRNNEKQQKDELYV